MFIQQGKTNWLVIIIVALFAAAAGASLMAYIGNTAFIAIQTADFAPIKKPVNQNPNQNPEQNPNVLPAVNQPTVYQSGDFASTVNAVNQFTSELYQQYKNTTDNVFFSPYSISSALQMTYEGARGQTAQEMQNVFHFSGDEKTRLSSFAALYNQINPENVSYQLSTANALWAQKDYPFLPDYLKIAETYYHGKAANLDFIGNTEGSRQTINQWVSSKTNNKIPELFAQGTINPLTRLVLTNAVYFKGKWDIPFEKTLTQEKDFTTVSSAKVKVPMMNNQSDFLYTKTADYQAVELPYENNDLSMIIILPKNGKMAAVENGLSADTLGAIKQSMNQQLVNIYLPKFKFDTSYNMNDTLSQMGMSVAFNPDKADFTGMYDRAAADENLYINLVVHKAYVDVNEEGTEATAATGVAMQATSAIANPPEPIIFNADHPFIFAIVHNQTGAILFMGKVNDPTK